MPIPEHLQGALREYAIALGTRDASRLVQSYVSAGVLLPGADLVRLEEIPRPNDFVEYEILDQSVIVVRSDDLGVRAFQNACRHRGVRPSLIPLREPTAEQRAHYADVLRSVADVDLMVI